MEKFLWVVGLFNEMSELIKREESTQFGHNKKQKNWDKLVITNNAEVQESYANEIKLTAFFLS